MPECVRGYPRRGHGLNYKRKYEAAFPTVKCRAKAAPGRVSSQSAAGDARPWFPRLNPSLKGPLEFRLSAVAGRIISAVFSALP